MAAAAAAAAVAAAAAEADHLPDAWFAATTTIIRLTATEGQRLQSPSDGKASS